MGNEKTVKIGITGCAGRMGGMLVRELRSGAHPGLVLAAGSEKKAIHDAGFPVVTVPAELFTQSDVIIDFTVPVATFLHTRLAAEHKKPIVIGTTGLGPAEEKEIREAAKKCPIVYAANMSVGVNLMLALVEQAAAKLNTDFDIEINETHHKHKKDAPSGTALALGKAAAKGRGIAPPDKQPADRGGERQPGMIGFSVQRGGDVVGEHTVSFFGTGERVALTHVAMDRALFARGALQAARWVAGQPPGLYSMRDVLGL